MGKFSKDTIDKLNKEVKKGKYHCKIVEGEASDLEVTEQDMMPFSAGIEFNKNTNVFDVNVTAKTVQKNDIDKYYKDITEVLSLANRLNKVMK